ncbi:MAG: plastocyanin/azurin family copper-binding protein [bacterium]
MRLRALALALALVIPSSALADTVIVQMTTDPSQGFQPRFVPADVTIQPGDTVRWVNTDEFSLEHGTCSGTGSSDPLAGQLWQSPSLPYGQWFEHTFDDPGMFEYFSVPHEFAGMFGVVRVGNSTDIPDIEDSTWGRTKALFESFLPRD